MEACTKVVFFGEINPLEIPRDEGDTNMGMSWNINIIKHPRDGFAQKVFHPDLEKTPVFWVRT